MSSRRLQLLILSAAFLSVGAIAACSSSGGDEADDDGSGDGIPGDGSGQAIVSEHQLTGSELPDKTIALTFDDGPGPRTVELTQYLHSQGIPATFFINGMNVPNRQAAVDAVTKTGGFILGNHTQNHLDLPKLTTTKIGTEVAQTDTIVSAAQPDGPFLFRAPFGATNGTVTATMNNSPMKKYTGSVFWDMGGALTATAAADWDCWGHKMTIQACGALYLQEIRARKHGIVLMHDIHNPTIDMVKEVVIPALQADGWKFAALTDVPSIKRAMAANDSDATDGGAASSSGSAGSDPSGCSSSSLGKSVAAGSCVQSKADQKWYVCAAGDWADVSDSSDARCTGDKYPAQ